MEQDGQGFPQGGGGQFELVEQFFAVDTLNAIEVGGGQFCFVGLEVADQLPLDFVRALGLFFHGLLHPVFPYGTQPIALSVVGGCGRIGLGHRQQFNGRRIAAHLRACDGDLFTNGISPLFKRLVGGKHNDPSLRVDLIRFVYTKQ